MVQQLEKTVPITPTSGEEAVPQSFEEELGQYLIDRSKLRAAEFRHARRLAAEEGVRLSVMLIRLGLVSERDMAEAFSALLDLPLLATNDYDSGGLNGQVSLRFLKESRAVPVLEEEDAVVVAMADPSDRYVQEAIALAYGKPISLRVGLPSEIEAALERQAGGKSAMGQIVEHLGADEEAETDVQHLKDMASEAPVVRLVNLLIQRAVESRASDIHIEPFENSLRVRYRIDGVLRDVEAPPARSTAAVISRFKIMAKLNIAERRLPQDGRIQLRIQGRELDLRVSTVPTLYGESVVLRLLDKGSVVLDFDSLGFQGSTLERFLRVLEMPHGIIIVTGPTGSGKSTTLYTALHKLNTPDRKIVTVEDPVEYQLEGINQIQVKPQIGLTFAGALRSIVRQDPDVIMIGEMRDRETAGIAVQSALTGHLVLSTLHTNDAAGGVTRLLDMGVEDYLLTSTVNGILAQRLVRTLCKHCAEPYEAMPEIIEELELHRFSEEKPVMLYRPVGCEHCNGIGYHGRAAIMEFLVMSDPIRRLVLQHADAGNIQDQAQKEGMRIMYEDGLLKALSGLTTIEEVIRVSQES
ncbi:general secretory pathway protein E [Nitrosococcus halophilus Nc 4]|uniref:Type II secretion system protein E n=1 Tax=Nitrosococcus halophilus (strain Nc4) TaxID=472759 RepID=D5BVJ9_NITHN|nr:type II secretion system ATPase GspE [Nitrosococcus halophilus]ADE13627.1 general secretory pathway protein E [Nitrosococcus halophilus Nc 4]